MKTTEPSSPAPASSFRRKLLFATILTALSLAALLSALELGLRLAGYGQSPHFARRVNLASGERAWRENRSFTAPFFSSDLVRRPVPFRLPGKKAPGTYRIFVLGSSAAMGDPEPSFSLARMLDAMLRDAYPQLRFEVVNAGVTAINSHLLRGMADDCAQLEPDLFIVYEGHNEVIGPFGPAGVLAPFLRSEAAIHALVWLKGTRVGQWVAAFGRPRAGEWGGMQMFLQQQIAHDDPRLDLVRAHFRANLISIIRAARKVGAHTLLCTVLTNQRDFAPFLSRHRPGLSSDNLARWNEHLQTAQSAERGGDLAAAESAYRAALALDDEHAELVFRLGRLLLRSGQRLEAQAFLQRALDLDTLRFRTDHTLNRVIRDFRNLSVPDAEVVDLASSLAARSESGVPGNEFLYEHVHLTFRGTYEAARDLFTQVSADLARRRLIGVEIPPSISYDDARIRLGYTAHEQAMIALELLNRFRSPPFTGQADHAFRIEAWARIADRASKLLSQPDALTALRASYQQALSASPEDWMLARNAGAMFVARKAPAEAVPLLERARTWIDDDVDTLVALGWAHHALGHTDQAEAVFAQARALEPRYPNLPPPSQRE